MNLSERHSKENNKQAKEAMLRVATGLTAKYIVAHERLNTILSGGNGVKGSKEDCLCCAIFKITKLMTKLKAQTEQIAEVYEMYFGEALPLEDIMEQAAKKFYPLAEEGESSDNDTDEKMFEGMHFLNNDEMPDEIREMVEQMTETLNKNGRKGQFSVSAVAIPKNGKGIFGVNPNDYPGNFNAFRDAVTKARKANKSTGKYDSMTGEEIIKENIIHNVEEMVASANADADKGPKEEENLIFKALKSQN